MDTDTPAWIETERVTMDNGWTRVRVTFLDGRRAVGFVAPGELVGHGVAGLVGVLATIPPPPVPNYVQ